MNANKLLAGACLAACMTAAQAATVTGVYDLTGSLGSSGPFSSNHLVMNTTYDTDTNALAIDVTTFDLDGVSWLSRAFSIITEDLGGNARFRATFRQQTLPDGSRQTFEIFYRFVWNFNTDTPVTGDGIASILSTSSGSSSNGRASATFTPTTVTPSVPEPGSAGLAALALLAAAGVRRGRWHGARTR